MSKLDDLIQEYCPDGVKYKRLGDLGHFYSGLNGKSKEDFKNGNASFITYMNVYSNMELNMKIADRVQVGENEKQNTVQYGDVLFTGSSETPDECGMSSVVTTPSNEKLYLNSFCFGYRFSNNNIFLPSFTKHLFRSHELRQKISKTASGVTRFNVSKKKMEDVTIPVPPMEVQGEIVRILDNFTELTAELTARRKQYEYYRDRLLETPPWETEEVKLEDIAIYAKERIASSEIDEDTYVGVDNLLQNKKGKTKSNHVPTECNLIRYVSGDTLIGNIRPYLRKIWFADNVGGTNGDVLVIHNISKRVLPKYLYYILASERFFEYDNSKAKGAKMPRGDKESIMKYCFRIPSLDVQRNVVKILDNFDSICSDLSSGLPAEIEARQKQYEYYRDKLLTFESK